jgi:tetratricopeptide (TPR) repeat protein
VYYIAARIDRRQNRWNSAVINLQKANDLDPRNSEFALCLGETYFEMRRYSEWEQLISKWTSSGITTGLWIQSNLAQIKLAQGNPAAAQSVLDQVPLDFTPTETIWNLRFNAALYLRDYDGTNGVIASMPAKLADRFPFRWITSPDGLVARARGDEQKARSIFLEARKRLDATWGIKVKDATYFALAAELDAGLGKKEEAIREGQRAVELLPITKDSLQGPGGVYSLALVYAWTGEHNRAFEQLESIARIPAGPPYGDLLLNPCWDDLRSDPRFDKIVAIAKAASK